MDWLAAINLAPWKYRHVLSQDGGPISHVTIAREETIGHPTAYQALAFLNKDLTSSKKTPSEIYGTADGSGTARFRHTAIYISISEAIERWAFYASRESNETKLGFHIEPSTSGMAAYPGINDSHVRKIAHLEAIERWSVAAWWDGFLPCKKIEIGRNGILGIEILSPWPDRSSVVLWTKSALSGRYTYGFACASNRAASINKASIELFRNKNAIEKNGNKTEVQLTMNEAQLVFFSKPHGHQTFLLKVEQSLKHSYVPELPKLIVDSPVIGPWLKYSRVWRCLFEPTSSFHTRLETNYFHF